MVLYTINYIDGLLKKYGPNYPRRTELATFSEVEARKVALSNLTFGYQAATGFLGHQVKGDEGFSFHCSEYDKVMLIFKTGVYKIIPVADKVFIGHDLLWMGKVESDLVFNIIYKNGAENISYIKRFKMPKFITDKEYELFPPHNRSLIQFISLGQEGHVRVYYTPNKRSKANYEDLALKDFLLKNAAARGKRVSNTRPVTRVRELESKEDIADEDKKPATLFDPKD
jgi:topoisomerase-4 subunit A